MHDEQNLFTAWCYINLLLNVLYVFISKHVVASFKKINNLSFLLSFFQIQICCRGAQNGRKNICKYNTEPDEKLEKKERKIVFFSTQRKHTLE